MRSGTAEWRDRLRGQQLDVVESGDEFAAGDELLEVAAILQGAVVEDALPESSGG